MRHLCALLASDDYELSKLGITIYDAQGEIKPFDQLVKEIWEKIVEDAVDDSIRQR